MHARLLRMRPGATHGHRNAFSVQGGSPVCLVPSADFWLC